MKFDCDEISINDEELGCTLTFYEKGNKGQYLLLQRTYPEDDFENDYYYIETNDDDMSGEFKNSEIEINVNRTKLQLKMSNNNIEISINPTEKEFAKMKDILLRIANGKGKIIIHE